VILEGSVLLTFCSFFINGDIQQNEVTTVGQMNITWPLSCWYDGVRVFWCCY